MRPNAPEPAAPPPAVLPADEVGRPVGEEGAVEVRGVAATRGGLPLSGVGRTDAGTLPPPSPEQQRSAGRHD